MGSLLGGGTKSQTSTTTQETKRTLPGFVAGPYKSMIRRSEELSRQPFVGYDYRERVAPLTRDEEVAFQMIRDNSGKYLPLVEEAAEGGRGAMQLAAQGATTENIQARQNPFLDIVAERMRLENRRSLDDSLNRVGDSVQGAGAFGGTRQAVLESLAMENADRNLSNQQAQLSYDAYDRAVSQYNQDVRNQIGTSNLLAALAQQGQQAVANEASMVQGIGQQRRAIDQALRDSRYAEFAREQSHPYDQLNFLNSITAPAAATMAGTTTTNTSTRQVPEGPGLLQRAVGLGTSIAGMMGGNPFSAISGLGSVFGGGGGGAYQPGSGGYDPMVNTPPVRPVRFNQGGLVGGLRQFDRSVERSIQRGKDNLRGFTGGVENVFQSLSDILKANEFLKAADESLPAVLKPGTELPSPEDVLLSQANRIASNARQSPFEKARSLYEVSPVSQTAQGLGKLVNAVGDWGDEAVAAEDMFLNDPETPVGLAALARLNIVPEAASGIRNIVQNLADKPEELREFLNTPQGEIAARNRQAEDVRLAKELGLAAPDGVSDIAQIEALKKGTIPEDEIDAIKQSLGVRPAGKTAQGVPVETVSDPAQTRKLSRQQVQQPAIQETPQQEEKKRERNRALIAAGAAMMRSQGDFFEAVSDGLMAYDAVKQQELAAEGEGEEKAFDRAVKLQDMERERLHTEAYAQSIALQAEKLKRDLTPVAGAAAAEKQARQSMKDALEYAIDMQQTVADNPMATGPSKSVADFARDYLEAERSLLGIARGQPVEAPRQNNQVEDPLGLLQ